MVPVHLRLDMHGLAAAAQLLPAQVEFMFGEDKGHAKSRRAPWPPT
jgi:hypothetical protein